jgi:endo-1,4-beta-xylanase
VAQAVGDITSVTGWGLADDNTWLDTLPVTRKDVPLLFDTRLPAKESYWGVVGRGNPSGSASPSASSSASSPPASGCAVRDELRLTGSAARESSGGVPGGERRATMPG